MIDIGIYSCTNDHAALKNKKIEYQPNYSTNGGYRWKIEMAMVMLFHVKEPQYDDTHHELPIVVQELGHKPPSIIQTSSIADRWHFSLIVHSSGWILITQMLDVLLEQEI